MALNKSTLLIRDYENIRHILRDMYLYGCFSREDFVDMGISGRKYDNEQRRINAYLPKGFIRKRREGRKVLQYCSYNPFDCPENYLAETWRNKSFTMLDIMAYFYILQILGNGEEKTLTELLEEIPEINSENVFTKDNLRVKLEEMQEQELIQSRREGRNVWYSLKEDIWRDFTEAELRDLYVYLEFLKNVLPFPMPFYFLQKKLRLYMECERKKEAEPADQFLFRHSHLSHALDGEIVLDLLRAIRQKRYVTVKMRYGDVKLRVIPMKIIHDSTYDRQYLLCREVSKKRIRDIRLDKLTAVELEEAVPEDELEAAAQCKKAEQECWCTSGANNDAVEVMICFCFDEEREGFVLDRVRREGHGGELTREAPGRYLYRIMVRDPIEMIPWIRSFGERAQVIASGEYRIEERIAEDWRKAVKKYEAISRDRE